MHLLNNLKSFLYEKDYFINIFDNKIYIFNYVELIKLTSDEIKVKMDNFIINITGKNFLVGKMAEKELLIEGIIDAMRIDR